MEKERNKSGFIIGLLIGIIIILLVLVILFATDTISFKNKNGNTNEEKNPVTENNDSNEVDSVTLNSLFDLLGIPSDNRIYGNSRLSYYVSNNNYRDYAGIIISLYGNTWDKNSLFKNDATMAQDKKICPSEPYCMFITKENAEKIFNAYNFSGKITDYFNSSSNYNDFYGMNVSNTSVEAKWNGPDAGVTHNTSSEYVNSSDIRIIDKQVVSYYDEITNNNLKTINQTVTYDFKKDTEGNYYLNNVEVK